MVHFEQTKFGEVLHNFQEGPLGAHKDLLFKRQHILVVTTEREQLLKLLILDHFNIEIVSHQKEDSLFRTSNFGH